MRYKIVYWCYSVVINYMFWNKVFNKNIEIIIISISFWFLICLFLFELLWDVYWIVWLLIRFEVFK